MRASPLLALALLVACRPREPVGPAPPPLDVVALAPEPAPEVPRTFEERRAPPSGGSDFRLRCAATATPLTPARRDPSVRRARPLAYPPRYAATTPKQEAEAKRSLERLGAWTYLRMSPYGGYVDQLNLQEASLGYDNTCGFTQAQLERWADVLAEHAELFGIEGSFALESSAPWDHLHVFHPSDSVAVSIFKSAVDGELMVQGHFWPGLAAPRDHLVEADLRARASEIEVDVVVDQPVPTTCPPGAPCAQPVEARVVGKRRLRPDEFTQVSATWVGVGDKSTLTFVLVASLRAGRVELQLDMRSGAPHRWPKNAGLSTGVPLRDGGAALLRPVEALRPAR